MTNRDYILKTAPYDLLMKLNNSIKFSNEYFCLMEHLRDEYIYGVAEDKETRCRYATDRENADCDKCMQRWLNEPRN